MPPFGAGALLGVSALLALLFSPVSLCSQNVSCMFGDSYVLSAYRQDLASVASGCGTLANNRTALVLTLRGGRWASGPYWTTVVEVSVGKGGERYSLALSKVCGDCLADQFASRDLHGTGFSSIVWRSHGGRDVVVSFRRFRSEGYSSVNLTAPRASRNSLWSRPAWLPPAAGGQHDARVIVWETVPGSLITRYTVFLVTCPRSAGLYCEIVALPSLGVPCQGMGSSALAIVSAPDSLNQTEWRVAASCNPNSIDVFAFESSESIQLVRRLVVPLKIRVPQVFAFCDVTGDALPDLIVQDVTGVKAFDVTSGSPLLVSEPSGNESVAAGDLVCVDLLGRGSPRDLLTCPWVDDTFAEGQCLLMMNVDSRGREWRTQRALRPTISTPVWGDFDGDGHTEVVLGLPEWQNGLQLWPSVCRNHSACSVFDATSAVGFACNSTRKSCMEGSRVDLSTGGCLIFDDALAKSFCQVAGTDGETWCSNTSAQLRCNATRVEKRSCVKCGELWPCGPCRCLRSVNQHYCRNDTCQCADTHVPLPCGLCLRDILEDPIWEINEFCAALRALGGSPNVAWNMNVTATGFFTCSAIAGESHKMPCPIPVGFSVLEGTPDPCSNGSPSSSFVPPHSAISGSSLQARGRHVSSSLAAVALLVIVVGLLVIAVIVGKSWSKPHKTECDVLSVPLLTRETVLELPPGAGAVSTLASKLLVLPSCSLLTFGCEDRLLVTGVDYHATFNVDLVACGVAVGADVTVAATILSAGANDAQYLLTVVVTPLDPEVSLDHVEDLDLAHAQSRAWRVDATLNMKLVAAVRDALIITVLLEKSDGRQQFSVESKSVAVSAQALLLSCAKSEELSGLELSPQAREGQPYCGGDDPYWEPVLREVRVIDRMYAYEVSAPGQPARYGTLGFYDTPHCASDQVESTHDCRGYEEAPGKPKAHYGETLEFKYDDRVLSGTKEPVPSVPTSDETQEDLVEVEKEFVWSLGLRTVLDMPEGTREESDLKAGKAVELALRFEEEAKMITRTIVEEMGLPDESKTIRPNKRLGGVAGGEKFTHDGIFLKFATDSHGIYGGDEFAGKAAAHEIHGSNAYLQSEGGRRLNVPLSVLVDFAGFRVIAMSQVPIGAGTLRYGSNDGGNTVQRSDEELNELMEEAAKAINLKPHVTGDESKAVLCGPCDIEGHRGEDGRCYVVDTARVFPPEAVSNFFTAFSLSGALPQALGNQGLSEALATSRIEEVSFPRKGWEREVARGNKVTRVKFDGGVLCYDCKAESVAPVNSLATTLAGRLVRGDAVLIPSGFYGKHLFTLLRPELVRSNAVPLSSDAFTLFGQDGSAIHEEEVRDATQRLRAEVISRLVRDLADGVVLVKSSRDLTRSMHERGINMRYLAMVFQQVVLEAKKNSRVKVLSDVIFTEMVTRSVKSLVKGSMRSACGEKGEGGTCGVLRAVSEAALKHINLLLWLEGVASEVYWRGIVRVRLQIKYCQTVSAWTAESWGDLESRSKSFESRSSLFRTLMSQLGLVFVDDFDLGTHLTTERPLDVSEMCGIDTVVQGRLDVLSLETTLCHGLEFAASNPAARLHVLQSIAMSIATLKRTKSREACVCHLQIALVSALLGDSPACEASLERSKESWPSETPALLGAVVAISLSKLRHGGGTCFPDESAACGRDVVLLKTAQTLLQRGFDGGARGGSTLSCGHPLELVVIEALHRALSWHGTSGGTAELANRFRSLFDFLGFGKVPLPLRERLFGQADQPSFVLTSTTPHLEDAALDLAQSGGGGPCCWEMLYRDSRVDTSIAECLKFSVILSVDPWVPNSST